MAMVVAMAKMTMTGKRHAVAWTRAPPTSPVSTMASMCAAAMVCSDQNLIKRASCVKKKEKKEEEKEKKEEGGGRAAYSRLACGHLYAVL